MPIQNDLGSAIIQEFEELFERRAVWDDHYQIVGDFVHGSKQEFTELNTPGERLNEERHTSIAVFASRSLASALIGMLWPNGAQSMKLVPSRNITDNRENKEYFERVTEIMVQAMNDPLAGLTVALDEYMLDQTAFGTSGIGVFKGRESDLHFEAWGTAQLFIDEGDEGRVEKEYRHFRWHLNRVAETYGLENLSPRLQERFKSRKNTTEQIQLIHAIKRRNNRDTLKRDAFNMPYMSVVVERETKHVIRESGFTENPVKVTRFRKLPYEVYGRSPGIDALSDVLELDYLTERFTVNVDKTGDPPLIVLDDGRFGGGIIDTSPAAINVMDVSGRVSNNIDPIKPLFTVGELNTTLTRMEQLREAIGQHFFLDKLLDFNNETQMTASEALIRDRIRAAALGSIFNRQVAELFDPLISRSFNMLLLENKLGVTNNSPEQRLLANSSDDVLIIPDEIARKMAQGQDVFEIKYFTPAARMLQLQRSEALNQLTLYVQTLQAADPQAGDIFNNDEAIKIAAEVAGLSNILRSDEEVQGIRIQRAEQQQAAQQAEQAKLESESARNLNQAGVL